MIKHWIKNKKGYSLLEVVVSLAIIAVMMVMLTNVMVISLTVSAKTSARANTREEVSNILASLKRDVRNAEVIKNCTGEDSTAVCEGILSVSGAFSWGLCNEDDGTKVVCKLDRDGKIVESTPSHINIDKLIFDVGFDKTLDKRTILVTIVASNEITKLNVKNVIQQTSISTRNYEGLTSFTPGPTYVCGNGIQESGEECDDGNSNNTDSCSTCCLVNTTLTTTINAQSSVCSAGSSVSKAKNGCGGNSDVPPAPINVPTGTEYFVATSVTGQSKWMGCGSGPEVPDGNSGAVTGVISCVPSISAMKNWRMALSAVFLSSNSSPTGTPPARLSYTNNNHNLLNSYSPLIQQSFVVGDGKDASGNEQKFYAPAGAAYLYFGFFDSGGFGTGNAGCYGDNCSSLTANLKFIRSQCN